MIKYRKNCKVCTAVRGNDRLRARIYKSTWYIPDGYESLSDIAKECAHLFGRAALYNHCREHQKLETRRRTAAVMDAIIKQEETREDAVVENEIVKAVEAPLVISQAPLKPTFEDVWDEVIDIGNEQLKNGNMKVTANVLLKAAADKANFESKKQDRQLAFMQMVAHFASGESQDGTTTAP